MCLYLGIIENMIPTFALNVGIMKIFFLVMAATKNVATMNLTLLAQIPLHIDLRADIDNGYPTVAANQIVNSQIYLELASHVVSANLLWQGEPASDNIMFIDVTESYYCRDNYLDKKLLIFHSFHSGIIVNNIFILNFFYDYVRSRLFFYFYRV